MLRRQMTITRAYPKLRHVTNGCAADLLTLHSASAEVLVTEIIYTREVLITVSLTGPAERHVTFYSRRSAGSSPITLKLINLINWNRVGSAKQFLYYAQYKTEWDREFIKSAIA